MCKIVALYRSFSFFCFVLFCYVNALKAYGNHLKYLFNAI